MLHQTTQKQSGGSDPVLQTPVPASRANWLGGPLRRHCKDIRDVEFSVELDTHCTVRGSYEIIYVAKASMIGGKPERRFVMFRISCMIQLSFLSVSRGWAGSVSR
jgi:hypothetical protein